MTVAFFSGMFDSCKCATVSTRNIDLVSYMYILPSIGIDMLSRAPLQQFVDVFQFIVLCSVQHYVLLQFYNLLHLTLSVDTSPTHLLHTSIYL